jgi:hypothetical protein
VRAASIVASQQRQRLFDLLSKVSLLSDRSARGCVSAAIFAGTTQELGIALILLSAALGAMLGSTIGFWIGDRYSEARFEEKLAVTRASGTRHSSIRFVAGELNPMATREAPFLNAARQAEDSIMVVYGLDAAAILGGDGSFGGFVQCCGCIVPHAKLAVHEQFPDQVAATIQNFLLGP